MTTSKCFLPARATSVRRSFHLLLLIPVLLLPARLGLAQPRPPEVNEDTAPPDESADDAEQPEEQDASARVSIFVFVEGTPADAVSIELDGRSAATTNENGSAVLTATRGKHPIRLLVPRDALPEAVNDSDPIAVDVGELDFSAGLTVEALVTLGPDGTLQALDVEGADALVAAELDKETDTADRPTGTLAGTVADLEGKAVPGARVFARGAAVDAETDAQGRFSLELPEGQWDLSIIHADYSTESRPGIEIAAGEQTTVQLELTPASVTLDDFVITAPYIEGSIASTLDERRESASMTDAISAEDIARTPAGDAAGAAQRVVGVTVVGGRYVYVRGLGDRYTNALVNGSPLPSPEPDKSTVPLDLFPTQVIGSLDVAKTFTPDVPADFAGGSVRIETITVPDAMLFSVSVSGGYDSQATFRERYSYPGSSTDWLGFDDGSRALPSEIPTDYPLRAGSEKPDGSRVSRDEVAEAAPALNSQMWATRETNPPNHGVKVMVGNGWDLGKDVRLGALAALTYSRGYELREEIIRQFNVAGEGADTDVTRWIDGTATVASESVRWGAFGSVGTTIGDNHEINLLGLRSQLADNTTTLVEIFHQNNDGTYSSSRFDFMSRSLDFGQLRGHHVFPGLYDAELDWRLSLSRAGMDQPDLRDTVYFRGAESDTFNYVRNVDSGRHFFAQMEEDGRSASLDWTQPIVKGDLEKKVKVGGMLTGKDRLFEARRFNFGVAPRAPLEPQICGPTYDPVRCPRELFVPENIDGSVLQLQENVDPNDAYEATADVYAAYLMGDIVLFPDLRFIGGARTEITDQSIVGFNQFAREANEDSRVDFDSVDVLPSLSAVYGFTDSLELRGAVSQTLARPQLRELAPFQFSNYFAGVLTNGNPDLQMTKIVNTDLRLDFFPEPREVISASIFWKDFTDPIEPVLVPSSSSTLLEYRNARGASLVGAELEARKNLGFLNEALDDFSLMGNLTLATSQIRVAQTGGDESGIGLLTNTERPMVNQAPYVINLALDYGAETGTQVRLLYNVSGRQVVGVGSSGLDDSYLQPRHLVDLTASQAFLENFRVSASAKNILNAQYLVTLGREARDDRAVRSYRTGTEISLSLGYSY